MLQIMKFTLNLLQVVLLKAYFYVLLFIYLSFIRKRDQNSKCSQSIDKRKIGEDQAYKEVIALSYI